MDRQDQGIFNSEPMFSRAFFLSLQCICLFLTRAEESGDEWVKMPQPLSHEDVWWGCPRAEVSSSFRETVSILNCKCVALPRKQIWLLLEIMLTSSVRILSTFDQLGENRVWPYLLSGALSTTLSRPVFPRRSWSSWSSLCRWMMVVTNDKDIHLSGFRPEPQGASSMTLTGHVSKTLSFWTIHSVTPLTVMYVETSEKLSCPSPKERDRGLGKRARQRNY